MKFAEHCGVDVVDERIEIFDSEGGLNRLKEPELD